MDMNPFTVIWGKRENTHMEGMEELPSWGSFIYHSLFQHSINWKNKHLELAQSLKQTQKRILCWGALLWRVHMVKVGGPGVVVKTKPSTCLCLPPASLLPSLLICFEHRETSARSERGHLWSKRLDSLNAARVSRVAVGGTQRRISHWPECSRRGRGRWDCSRPFLWPGKGSLHRWPCCSRLNSNTEGSDSFCLKARDFIVLKLNDLLSCPHQMCTFAMTERLSFEAFAGPVPGCSSF